MSNPTNPTNLMKSLDYVVSGDYSSFADTIKNEFKVKLSNDSTIKNYTHLVQQIQDRKNIFKMISQ